MSAAKATQTAPKRAKATQTAKRHPPAKPKDNIKGITKPAIRRLARRAGVKRINRKVYDATRAVLNDFLNNIIGDTVVYTEHAHRKTVSVVHVLHALKRNGRTLYGYGG
jgi:histone H4